MSPKAPAYALLAAALIGLWFSSVSTYDFVELPNSPTLELVPGPVVRWKAILPTLARAGAPFRLAVVGEDRGQMLPGGADAGWEVTAELPGINQEDIDLRLDAIEGAIGRASETIKNLDWFQVKEVRGQVVDGKVAWYQVSLGVGFRVVSPAREPTEDEKRRFWDADDPVTIETLRLGMFWSPLLTGDRAHTWLREVITESAATLH